MIRVVNNYFYFIVIEHYSRFAYKGRTVPSSKKLRADNQKAQTIPPFRRLAWIVTGCAKHWT